MESEVAEESEFSRQVGDFFFGYIWMDMDFTVLGRTPEGVQVCMLVVLQTQKYTGRKRTRERRLREGFGDENWNKT